jgi:hypothetical protein
VEHHDCEHGSLIQNEDKWQAILPCERQPLQLFDQLLCELVNEYGEHKKIWNPFDLRFKFSTA